MADRPEPAGLEAPPARSGDTPSRGAIRALDHELRVALAFLTRLPVRTRDPWEKPDLAASAAMFPVVGALVGAIGALAFAAAVWLALPPSIAAVLALAAMILATGGLHEDGLADVADGFGGGDRGRKLLIMRDSRIGTYGVLALLLALMARGSALAALAEPAAVAAALIAAGAVSRAPLPLAMAFCAQARAEGLAAGAGRPHAGRAAAALLVALAIACLCLPPSAAVPVMLGAALAAAIVILLALRQIGGITGDVLGAAQQLAEIACLLVLVSSLRA